MSTPTGDARFSDAVATLYQDLLVPMIFAPYATDLAARLQFLRPQRVLEVAAGTGVLTRELARSLPPEVEIVATDLNGTMLAVARKQRAAREVVWRQADAMALPFADGSFDAVVCQFGAMFFPDKARAFAEARRVLRPGGTLLFNTWDRIGTNDFANLASETVAGLFPADPPRFLERLPHGYFLLPAIVDDLAGAGFVEAPTIVTVAAVSRATNADTVARAYCQGTPLRGEIEGREGIGLERATARVAATLAERFGPGPVAGRIQALVVQVAR